MSPYFLIDAPHLITPTFLLFIDHYVPYAIHTPPLTRRYVVLKFSKVWSYEHVEPQMWSLNAHHTMPCIHYGGRQVTHHGNLACVISRCGSALLPNNLEPIMSTLFKLVYKVGKLNNKLGFILCVTNPLAEK